MTMVQHFLWIGLGGAIGSMARYATGLGAQRLFPDAWLPIGTLTVNVVGCFALGTVATWLSHQREMSDATGLFIMVGLLGGFTTFSTFGVEALELFRGEHVHRGFLHIGAHVALGLGAVWLGVTLGQRWFAEG